MSLVIPTATSIKLRFPELVDATDAQVEFAIEEARADMGDGSNWTANANLALVYLCAHYLSASIAAAGGGSNGQIASESIGRFSISYVNGASNAATQDDLSSSPYGLRYLDLTAANFCGPRIA